MHAYMHSFTPDFHACRVIEALTKADSVLKLSEIVHGLQSDQKEKQLEAVEKYTRLTDHVWHHILTSTDVHGLEEVRG